MPRMRGGHIEYLPVGSENLNRQEKPYTCWAAVIAVSVLSGVLGYILASNYCYIVTGGW